MIKSCFIPSVQKLWGLILFCTALNLGGTEDLFAVDSKSPIDGGTLIFGRGGDSVNLDPAAVTDGESLNVTDNIFDNLVTTKSGTTDIIPALATKWDISADGLTYTFYLRKDAKFHDGTDVNADAVIFSFMRQKDPAHKAYKFSGPYVYFKALGLDKLIKGITKTDDYTVKFQLTRPEAPFLSCLSMQSFAIVSPTAVMKYQKKFGRNPVGSGPFVFKKWEKNQKIVLARNSKYWEGAPHLKTLIFRSIPDNSTRLIEMMAQKIHVMDNPNPDDISTLKEKLGGKVNFAKQAGFNVGYLAMNNDKKPFNNVLVRKAIAHAINKEGIIKAVYAGYAEVAKNPMPPTLWGHNDAVPGYEYNPKKAKELLKKAGYPEGFTTTLWAMPVPRPYMPDGRKVAEAIQGDLAKIGVKVKIVSYEWGTYLDKTEQGEHDMALMGWTGDIGDPDNFLYVLLDKDNTVKPAQNISFYKSQKLHDVLIAAKAESNQDKRIELYEKAQSIIYNDVPMVPLAHSITVVPTLKRVQNFQLDPTGRRRFSKVWLAK
ncbi:MAG: ABC transporter substrate-binding protein [Bdellovibrionota bacterium]